MATIHAFLRQYNSEEDDTAEETVHYGPSTSNKVLSIFFNLYIIDVHCTVYLLNLHKTVRQMYDVFLLQIERWWRELHHRLEKYFKRQLLMLLEQGYYEPDSQTDRYYNIEITFINIYYSNKLLHTM